MFAVLFGIFVVSDGAFSKYPSTNQCDPRYPPANGFVDPDESWYSTGDQIAFKCNEGYSLYGADEDICLNGGIWKMRKTPHCKPLCYTRTPPDNGKVSHSPSQKFYAVGENISFTCNPGFELEGKKDDECVGLNRWLVNITPRCLPVPRCRSRYVPRNGHLYPNEEYFIPGDRIRFECDQNYHLVGFQYDYCQVDGTWKINAGTYCTPFCNPLKIPESGLMTPQKQFYNVGDVVIFSCYLQYKLVGAYKSKCMFEDTWSNVIIPKCIQYVCLPRPPPLHGYVKPHQDYYERNSIITYSCKDAYKLVGTKKDECIFPGKWRIKKTPKCVQLAPCDDRNETMIKELELLCGLDCITDADCAAGKRCTCDGACGRTCVDLSRQECRRFGEFRCFWGGECISGDLKCNGVHDCLYGEDETAWFAGCNYCPGQFHCYKESGKVECIDPDYVCDGDLNCFNGEDELYNGTFSACRKYCKKDSDKADLAGRPQCRKKCKSNKDCKNKSKEKKACVCDHECGMSCVAVERTCPGLDKIANLRSIRYVKKNYLTGLVEDVEAPYSYDVQAIHTCEPGYVILPTDTRMCHGRYRTQNKTWTAEVVCAPSCEDRNDTMIKEFKLSCGLDCRTDADCAAGEKCTCDGACSRTCVDLSVTCGDPLRGLTQMKGWIVNYSKPPYYFNTTLKFACQSDQRLLGSSERTCLGNGKWSGISTVCDNIGNLTRCPHPGIPIDGKLDGNPKDSDFEIHKTIRFSCDDGRVMIGEAKQECMITRQWSGDGAPDCVEPWYRDTQHNSRGKIISINSAGGIEVYFVIDLSKSIYFTELQSMITFAKRLVERLSLNDTTSDRVSYGIVVFATKAEVKLTRQDLPIPSPKEVQKLLDEILLNRRNIQKPTGTGTDMPKALYLLDQEMISFSYVNDPDLIIKRHVLVMNKLPENTAHDARKARKRIQQTYLDNPPEFYSITGSARSQSAEYRRKPTEIVSEEKNHIYVEDFYKLHTYVDKITDVREDYETCGQAGDENDSVRKYAERGRVVNGEKAPDRAWPWQVLICRYVEEDNIVENYKNVHAGGSLINDKWVLTAAQMFVGDAMEDGWQEGYLLSLGIIRRPMNFNTLDASVKMFHPEEVYMHEKFEHFNGKLDEGTFTNDIALIKIGIELIPTPGGRYLMKAPEQLGAVALSPYIKPVCLPCSPTSCVSKVLMKKDSAGKVLLTGDETPKERCKIEYDFLMKNDDNSDAIVVVTGFGHNASRTDEDNVARVPITPPVFLQQALLKIEDRAKCKDAVDRMTRIKHIFGFAHRFTNEMFCAIGIKDDAIPDTCQGDSGGPVTREIVDETTKGSCFVQLGIVSFGYGCAIKDKVKNKADFIYPGFYTDVTSMVSWINKIMTDHKKPKN